MEARFFLQHLAQKPHFRLAEVFFSNLVAQKLPPRIHFFNDLIATRKQYWRSVGYMFANNCCGFKVWIGIIFHTNYCSSFDFLLELTPVHWSNYWNLLWNEV